MQFGKCIQSFFLCFVASKEVRGLCLRLGWEVLVLGFCRFTYSGSQLRSSALNQQGHAWPSLCGEAQWPSNVQWNPWEPAPGYCRLDPTLGRKTFGKSRVLHKSYVTAEEKWTLIPQSLDILSLWHTAPSSPPPRIHTCLGRWEPFIPPRFSGPGVGTHTARYFCIPILRSWKCFHKVQLWARFYLKHLCRYSVEVVLASGSNAPIETAFLPPPAPSDRELNGHARLRRDGDQSWARAAPAAPGDYRSGGRGTEGLVWVFFQESWTSEPAPCQGRQVLVGKTQIQRFAAQKISGLCIELCCRFSTSCKVSCCFSSSNMY